MGNVRNRRNLRSLSVLMLWALLPGSVSAQVTLTSTRSQHRSKQGPPVADSRTNTSNALGWSFEENRGQTDPKVLFLARQHGDALFLTKNQAVLEIADRSRAQPSHTLPKAKGRTHQSVLRMSFLASDPDPKVEGQDLQPRKVYYADPHKTGPLTPTPTFLCVRYSAIYPGIDVVFYGNDQQLEFDLVVAPHADPGNIRMLFTGAQNVALESSGELSLLIDGQEVRLRKPLIYQEQNGVRTEIAGTYALQSGAANEVRFSIGKYDSSLPLTIDPSYSFGSNADDLITGLQADSRGQIYVLGDTTSPGSFPATITQGTSPQSDNCFLTKLDPLLNVVYSVLLENMQSCETLALSPNGVPYFTGFMIGNNQATTVASIDDSGGAPVFTEFPVGNYDSSAIGYGVTALTIDGTGNIFLLGLCRMVNAGDPPLRLNGFNTEPDAATTQHNTACTTVSAVSGLYDIRQLVLTAVDSQGQFLYGSYLSPGENSPNPPFHQHGLAVDNNRQAFIFGTNTSSLSVTPNAYQSSCVADCFYLMVLDTTKTGTNGSASLKYASYLWQSSSPANQLVRLGQNGSIYLASETTTGPDFPETQPTFSYPTFPGQVTTNEGIQLARFDLDALGAPTQFRYAFHFSPTTEVNASAAGDILEDMRLFPSGAIAVNSRVVSSNQDLIDIFYPSGQSKLAPIVLPLYPSSQDPSSTITADTAGNLIIARDTAAPPPAPGQLDVTVDSLASVDPGANTPPILQLQPDFTQLTADPAGLSVVYSLTAQDAEDGSGVFVQCTPPSGTFLPLGTMQVTCSATDSGNGTATESFNITVLLNSIPVPLGSPVLQPRDLFGSTPLTVSFSNVSSAGTLLFQIIGDAQALPPGLKPITPDWIYSLTTDATFTSAQVCVETSMIADNFNSLKLYRLITGVWTDVTTPGYPQLVSPILNRTATVRICGTVTSMGVFEIAEPGDPSAFIQTVAGTGGSGFNGDNIDALKATFQNARSGFADQAGNIYVADEDNDRVRKISNGIITTVAGNGTASTDDLETGDGGPATSATVDQPSAVAFDRAGNLFIAERGGCRIRRVDTSGMISTVAGSPGNCFGDPAYASSGDGEAATQATLGFIRGLAFDPSGNLFFSETGSTSNGHHIRRIAAGNNGLITGAPEEIISTVAGGSTFGFAGDGGPSSSALFFSPEGIAFDKFGNLFIADHFNELIRRISPGAKGYISGAPDDIITTVAGIIQPPNSCQESGDGGAATEAGLCFPNNVAFDSAGNLIIAETFQLRRVSAVAGKVQGAAGEIATRIAGTGIGNPNGDGSALSVDLIAVDVFSDPSGNTYIIDGSGQSNRVRRYGPFNAPAGSPVTTGGVSVTPTDQNNVPQPLQVTFATVTQQGFLIAVPVQPPPVLAANLHVDFVGTVYNISFIPVGGFAAPVTVCLIGGPFASSDQVWHDGVLLTPTVNTPTMICTQTSSLGDFGVVRRILTTVSTAVATTTPRFGHTATLLGDGRVLLAGGFSTGPAPAISSDLYDPMADALTPTADLPHAGIFETASLLDSGKVMIVPSNLQLYDPKTNAFSASAAVFPDNTIPPLNQVVLQNGTVLLISDSNNNSALYDFVSDSASTSFCPAVPESTNTLLNDGTVLVSGGGPNHFSGSSAEICDLSFASRVEGDVTRVGDLNIARNQSQAILLNSGLVLVVGGFGLHGQLIPSAELYDPVAKTFSLAGQLNIPRIEFTLTLLTNGQVLVVGGSDASGTAISSVEAYDPASDSFSIVGDLLQARVEHSATRLSNGSVFITGGRRNNGLAFAGGAAGSGDPYTALPTSEIYTPAMFAPPNLVSISVSPNSLQIAGGTSRLS